MQYDRSYSKRLTTALLTVVTALFLFSCKDGNEGLDSMEYNPEEVPSMITHDVTTFISESGVTRYRLDADVWMAFDRAKEPYWYFSEGIYVEIFTTDFEVEATIKADTAWRYTDQGLWKLIKNVHIENKEGEQFDSDELYWDEKNGRVYSDAYIEIQRQDSQLKGYGFESNQEMTDYRIFRPRDARFPIVDQPVSEGDSLAEPSDSDISVKELPGEPSLQAPDEITLEREGEE